MGSVRILRKVKIDGKWIFASVPLEGRGRPDASFVLHKGKKVAVEGGTFYLDSGRGDTRKRVPCGTDPASVKRAMQTQRHVIELRGRGMEVADAPEVVDARRGPSASVAELARAFRREPPTGYTVKTVKKYCNALESFAEFASARNVVRINDVTPQIVTRWIAHMQQKEKLDASTIVPKARIVLSQLKQSGATVEIPANALPKVIERERATYTIDELHGLFAACDTDEYELYQVFLQSGFRDREVAFLAWTDIDAKVSALRVTAKRDLGFAPKAYHERTVPVARWVITMLEERAERLKSDRKGLIFATSTAWRRGGSLGGKADRKMLQKLKQIARRAGLNCGCCIGFEKGRKVSCATHPVCKRWGLHKFRHTYATQHLRDKNVDLATLSRLLGHKDLATTSIYLHGMAAEQSQPHVERSTMARKFAGGPPEPGKVLKRSPKLPPELRLAPKEKF